MEPRNTNEEHTNVNLQENHDDDQENHNDQNIPQIGMIFDTEDGLYDYFKNYAYKSGFGIRKFSTRKEGSTTYYSLGCAKGGVYVPKPHKANYSQLSTKTGCKEKIRVLAYNEGRYVISGVSLEHKHVVSPNKSRFQLSHKKMDSYAKKRLELNDYAGIPLNKSFHALVVEVKGYDNMSFDESDCRNYIAKVRQLRLGIGDAEALHEYFVHMQRRSPNFFYVIDIDDEGRLRNVFWADARSRAAYESFRDVVSFDSTYLTNKYSMPFAPFVGVNHHGQSILFGCGLISREDTDTYVWLFKAWLECMKGRPPKATITDQCRSMQGAVAQVFPESHHHLCLWHIIKKISEKLSGFAQYKTMKRTLKTLVYESTDTQEFEDGWCKMIENYTLEKNEWLRSLFNDRRRWVPVYVKEFFWAGMSTTQRSESMNSFFDGYVTSKTSLRQFVEQYDNALKSKIEKETKADFECLNSSYTLITGFPFERQFQEAYTNATFKLFQDELRGMVVCNCSLIKIDGAQYIFHVTDIVEGKHGDLKKKVVYTVTYDEGHCDIQCSCHLFEFRGIVCRHMVKVLIEKDVKQIHSRYILSRWRKDVKHGHYQVINCYEDLMSGDEAKKFDQLCSNFYEVVHMANSPEKYEYLMSCIKMAKEKLNDDSNWSCSSNGKPGDSSTKLLPPFKVRSKWRPPSKRKESTVENIMKKKRNKKVCEGPEKKSSIGMMNTTSCEHGANSHMDNSYKFPFDLNE